MCKHCFVYPEDSLVNYNPDKQTLTGHCKCGATQVAYGMRWSIPLADKVKGENPDYLNYLDKQIGIC